MARRRPPPAPQNVPVLPAGLRRENTTVETWVPWSEQAPDWWTGEPPPHLGWRRLRAWRRWQDAVTKWGAIEGLDTQQLRELGTWPIAPPGFGPYVRGGDRATAQTRESGG